MPWRPPSVTQAVAAELTAQSGLAGAPLYDLGPGPAAGAGAERGLTQAAEELAFAQLRRLQPGGQRRVGDAEDRLVGGGRRARPGLLSLAIFELVHVLAPADSSQVDDCDLAAAATSAGGAEVERGAGLNVSLRVGGQPD